MKIFILGLLGFILMVAAPDAQAHSYHHDHYYPTKTMLFLPYGAKSVKVYGKRYYYHAGTYYKRDYNHGYVVVPNPHYHTKYYKKKKRRARYCGVNDPWRRTHRFTWSHKY